MLVRQPPLASEATTHASVATTHASEATHWHGSLQVSHGSLSWFSTQNEGPSETAHYICGWKRGGGGLNL